MGKIVSPKYLIGISLLCVESDAAELLAAAAGSAASSTVMGYMSEQAASVKSSVERPKTFDNEYNEAVCGLNRDKMRRSINDALKELDQQAQQTQSTFQMQSFSGQFTTNVFLELAKNAELIVRKHEIAVLSLDFIEFCKRQLFERIDRLKGTLATPHNPRVLGDSRAQSLDKERQERVEKAVHILTIWKNNLLAALHEKYPYTCEGGIKDRLVRSSNRHHERAKEWKLYSDWFGTVTIPSIDLQAVNPFSEEDNNPEAVSVREIYPLYDATFSFLRTTLDKQVEPEYLGPVIASYSSMAFEFHPSAIEHDKSKLLEGYRQSLASRESE